MAKTPEEITADLRAENDRLRGALSLTARVLKAYRQAPHAEAGEEQMLQLTVPASYPDRADHALEKASELLKEGGRSF